LIGRLIDKLIFGVALLFSLQMPLLVDHYHQYLAGWYKATQWQVDGYQATAKAHEYADANAMITHHLNNAEPSVRADAQQKLATIELLAQLNTGIQTFTNGHLLEKMMFMLHPQRTYALKDVVQNFKVGIPLSPSGLLFGVIFGLILNLLILLPFRLMNWGRRTKQPAPQHKA
jgi:hypothetical protein